MIICFLTVRPSKLSIKFYNKLNTIYDVYICVDDNDYIVPETKCKIIKIDNKICKEAGFNNMVGNLKKYEYKSLSRDKALYYFYYNRDLIKFNNIWLIEEDVFIPSINTIKNIDSKYPTCDLLVRQNKIYKSKDECKNWFWNKIFRDSYLTFPYGRSMICAIRISKKLLILLGSYATKYKKFFMDESIFNTIAIQNNLSIITPDELKYILWRSKRKHTIKTIKPNYLYHPMKSIVEQTKLRMFIQNI